MYIICSNFLVVVFLLWSCSYNLWASDIQSKLRFESLNKHSNEQGLKRTDLGKQIEIYLKVRKGRKTKVEISCSSSVIVTY